jgi:hypothetical protein
MLILEIIDDTRHSMRLERLQINEMAGLEELMVSLNKNNFEGQYDADIIASLKNLKNVQDTPLADKVRDVLVSLEGVSGASILSHLARQYNKRATYRASLVKDKEDLTQLNKVLQLEIVNLSDRINTYTLYLNNTKKFRCERGDKQSSSKCGYSGKDLLDQQVIQ